MKHALDNAFARNVPLDPLPEPFLFDLNWSAPALIAAVSGAMPPLHRIECTRSANDAAAHRPRRCWRFLTVSPLPMRFRIGG
jgi:hypothetical protein